MNSQLEIENLSKIHSKSAGLNTPQKEVRQHLNKITRLQTKLCIAEKNLRDLLKIHGLKVLC